jgi:outer membrane lipoprotein-sorting protein
VSALGLVLLLAAAPTVDDIVAQHVKARGGAAAIAAVQSIRMTGHATAGPGRTAIVRREMARPGRLRTELVFQGTTGVYAWDGAKGWRVSPLEGSLDAEPMAPEEEAAAAEQADLDGPLVDWKKKGHAVEMVGTEDVPGGGRAHHLKLTMKSGGVRHVWIDAASGMLVRMQSTRRIAGGREVALDTTFGDHRAAGGVVLPHLIETSARGRPQRLRIVVEKVELNPDLPATRFQMPH